VTTPFEPSSPDQAPNERPIGVLLDKIWALKRGLRANGHHVNMPALTVLSRGNDPYLLSDGRAGQWFADQVARFIGPMGTIHLRGLFYRCVAAGDVYRPNGKNGADVPFVNTEENWDWFTKIAAKNARWLGYVPFDRIVDERNAPPELFIPEWETTGWRTLPGDRTWVPSINALLAGFSATVAVTQPYRIILIGEKVSLKPFLMQIARRVGGELLLPTGEISDTQISNLATRCEEDGRPAAVLYFSDLDPSGRQMPVSVSRKLMALRDMLHPNLQISVDPVCLTEEQANGLDLPSTPLKDAERRRARWQERFGREQTEIDALIALHPNELRRITEEAVKPFYDPTLADRATATREAWEEEVAEWLDRWEEFQRAKEKVEEARNFARHAVQKLEEAQQQAEAVLATMQDPPELVEPKPELPGTAPMPLFSTGYDDLTAAQRLKAYRAYEDEDDAE
jgi:hypothetical protein